MTGLELIKAAFRLAGVYEVGEAPTADEANDALQSMNDMLSSWSADLRPVFCQRHDTYEMTGSIASYTIGPTGDFVQPRPNLITQAMVRIQGSLDYPLAILTPADYLKLNLKTLQGIPQYLMVNPTIPDIEVKVYYVPQQNYQLLVDSLISLDNQTLSGQVQFPPGYEEAIKYNLALRLCPEYGQNPTPFVIENAYASKAIIQRQNAMMMEDQMSPDFSAPGMGVVNFPWWWTGGPNPG